MIVSWFSGGVSSFIASWKMRGKIDKYLYTHIDDQHPDTLRFIKDCSKVLGQEIELLQSPYKSVDNVHAARQFINSPYGAPCTDYLKRRVRKEWEAQQTEDITYVWGLDCTEIQRAQNLVELMPEFKHEFPLIDCSLSKQDVHGIAASLGVKRPVMYDLGYQNNNCIGCVKGGMWYWNKIRRDFPEVFELRAKRERQTGGSMLKDKDGQLFLDELDPDRGREEDEISTQCGIYCMLELKR